MCCLNNPQSCSLILCFHWISQYCYAQQKKWNGIQCGKEFGWQCFFSFLFFFSFCLVWLTGSRNHTSTETFHWTCDDRRGPSENSDSCQIRAVNKQTNQKTCQYFFNPVIFFKRLMSTLIIVLLTPHPLHVNLKSIFDHPQITKISWSTLCHVSGSFPEHFCGIARDVTVGNQRHSGPLVSLAVLDRLVFLGNSLEFASWDGPNCCPDVG